MSYSSLPSVRQISIHSPDALPLLTYPLESPCYVLRGIILDLGEEGGVRGVTTMILTIVVKIYPPSPPPTHPFVK